MRVLDERTGVAVEIDGFARVEKHRLARIDLEDEILQRAEREHLEELVLLLLRHSFEFAQFQRGLFRRGVHTVEEVVGVDHRAFARFHLAFGQFHHTVGHVVDGVGPGEAQLAEDEFEHLEVIVLLVAHHVDDLVEVILVVALLGRTQVLGHVDRSAVLAEQQFLVQAVCSQVAPHAAVVAAVEHTFLKALFHKGFAILIGLGFVVDAVERNAEAAVGLVETGVDPAVHLFPERTDLGISLLPLYEHGLRLLQDGGVFLGFFLRHAAGHQLRDFSLEQVVELHVVVAYQMVALLAGGLRRLAAPTLEPGQHRFADVDATVIHQVHLQHFVSASSEQLTHRPTQQVVADMSQVQRLVGVRARELDHDGPAARGQLPEVGLRGDLGQVRSPIGARYLDIEESFDHIEAGHLRFVLLQPGSDLRGRGLGGFVAGFQQREDDEGHIALEFLAGRLHLDQTGGGFRTIEGRNAAACSCSNILKRIHHSFFLAGLAK